MHERAEARVALQRAAVSAATPSWAAPRSDARPFARTRPAALHLLRVDENRVVSLEFAAGSRGNDEIKILKAHQDLTLGRK